MYIIFEAIVKLAILMLSVIVSEQLTQLLIGSDILSESDHRNVSVAILPIPACLAQKFIKLV